MSKGKKEKVVPEITEETPIIPEDALIVEEALFDGNPTQVLEEEIVSDTVIIMSEPEPKVDVSVETESEFLFRLLQIQEEGGWGRHLHPIIQERLNSLK